MTGKRLNKVSQYIDMDKKNMQECGIGRHLGTSGFLINITAYKKRLQEHNPYSLFDPVTRENALLSFSLSSTPHIPQPR